MVKTHDFHGDQQSARRLALGLVIAVAFAVRLWALLTHTTIIHPDETFQYFEQAHRLAFGSGVVPWEFIDGIRSWLLPALIAAVMRLAALVSSDPEAYVFAVRFCCVVLSLTVPYTAFRLAERRRGLLGGVVAGLLCALWHDLVYFAPVVMTEPLAAYALLWALWLGDGQAPVRTRRLVLAGLLHGLTCCLRYQYLPAVALAILWQHGRGRRLAIVVASAVAMVGLGDGVLDTITWGAPFQSVWLNFDRNAVQGISGAMGTEPWYFFPTYFLATWNVGTPVFLVLIIIGAMQLPELAVPAALMVALHSATPHKELRFIFLASAAVPLLVGLGAASMPRLRRIARLPAAVTLACAMAAAVAWFSVEDASPPDAWHRDRSMVAAFRAAHAEPGLCGLGVKTLWVYRTGGYTYLNRDVPIYFETAEAVQHLEASPVRLRLQVVLDGQLVPQYPDEQFARHAQLFNVLIGPDQLPGFTTKACFGAGSPDDPTICVFRRPGQC